MVPVINENDTTATDEITFGDNDFLAAQVAILLEARLLVLLTDTDGLHTADPRTRPDAELVAEVDDFAELDGDGDRRPHLGLRLGRDAQQGRRRRDGERGRDPGVDLQRHRGRARCSRRPRGERGRHPLRRQRRQGVRASSSGSSYAKPARGRVVVDDGAARVLREQRLEPAAGRDHRRSRATSRPAMRSRSSPTASSSARASSTTRRPSWPG